MRIQIEIDSLESATLEELKQETGARTYKELLWNAVTLLQWARNQRAQGRIVGSIDEAGRFSRELQMPAIERMAPRSTRAQVNSRKKTA
jgi:hypothetical protein